MTPDLVRRYAERALPGLSSLPERVRVTQVGTMWQKPGGRALTFTATEEFSVTEVEFSWRARFPLLPLVTLGVVDRYRAGEGLLEARLFGLVPVMRQTGAAVAQGEAMRYLAELPWVPQALLGNEHLAWTELDDGTVEACTVVGVSRVAVRFQFDDAGDIVCAFSDARPRPEGKTVVERPWGGVFSDYQVVGGVRVPTRAEVRWELPEGPFVYWAGTVTSLETLDR